MLRVILFHSAPRRDEGDDLPQVQERECETDRELGDFRVQSENTRHAHVGLSESVVSAQMAARPSGLTREWQ